MPTIPTEQQNSRTAEQQNSRTAEQHQSSTRFLTKSSQELKEIFTPEIIDMLIKFGPMRLGKSSGPMTFEAFKQYKINSTKNSSVQFFTSDNEYPIENLHFIWLGSSVPEEYRNNLKRWRILHLDRNINLWFSTRSLQDQKNDIAALKMLSSELNIRLR